MTNGEIKEIFDENYPQMKVSDYRPLSSIFVKDMQGITIWTDKGDIIFFFPGQRSEVREANAFKPSVQKLEITMPSGCPDFYGLKEAPATSRGCSHCKECWEEAIENWLNKEYTGRLNHGTEQDNV